MRDERAPSAVETLVCGGLAGVAAKTAIAPLDRVKVHFQVRNPAMAQYSGHAGGVFRAIAGVYRESGFLALYRGHSAMLLRIFPYAAINFSTYERARHFIYSGRPAQEQQWFLRILPGSIAGATAVFCTYPLDIIRVRMAYNLNPAGKHVFPTQYDGAPSLRSVAQKLWTEGRILHGFGISGFYQGFLPTVAGILPYAGVSFASFEAYKRAYSSVFGGPDKVPAAAKFLLGMAAGITAQTVSYPLDVIRRRAQVLRVAPHLAASGNLQLRSIQNLFAGLSINYIKVAPATGISFAVYELLREHLFHHRGALPDA